MSLFQQSTITKQSDLAQKPLLLFFAILFGAIATIHFVFLTQIGFMSDDYTLMVSIEKGDELWHLHHSPLLEYFWKWTALKGIGAFYWRIFVLSIHVANVCLLYLISHRQLKLNFFQTLFLCACFAMSPAGIEALAWTCSAGYVLTVFWIFLAWQLFFKWQETTKTLFLKGMFLAALQVAAFFTWDWGILLFPILAIFALTREDYGRSVKLLLPTVFCWVVGSALRLFSSYGIVWQQNSLERKFQFLLGAPFLGFFPNITKEFYSTWSGLLVIGLFVAFIYYAAISNRYALASMVCFFLSIFPWVNGGNPSSRYFYVSMPFIFIAVAIGIGKIKNQFVALSLAGFFLLIQLAFTYERDVLWKKAFEQSQNISEAAKDILKHSSNLVVLVNIPDAYGPEKMPMRPQMWFSGFNQLFPDIKVVKARGCPFIWTRGTVPFSRQEISDAYQGSTLYEAVYRSQNDWQEFKLIPFASSN